MSKYDEQWIVTEDGKRIVYAVPFESNLTHRTEFYGFIGAYYVREGGFMPQHRRTKVHLKEIDAKRDVIGHAISQRRKEITKLQRELDRLSKEPA